MFTRIKAAIIDLDGTLLDTAADIHCASNNLRAELGLAPLDLETVRNFVGKGVENLVRAVLAVDFDEAEVARRFPEALPLYMRHYEHANGAYATFYPQVKEGLAAFGAKGIRMACVTNKPIALTLPLLEKTGLLHHFDVVYGGDSLPKKKPDPLPLLQVCKDFGLQPQEAVAIGDSMNDAQAARAAGCLVLTVPYGYNHGQPIQDVDSDGIVETLLEAASLLQPT